MWAYRPMVKVVGFPRNVEGITAGMARISRDPTPIPQLVREAKQNTTLARARNERIVYQYGHNSVAEHGTFSVAIWDIPRHLSLDLVSHRLASYTQQSARYIPFERVKHKFFVPEAFRKGPQHTIYKRTLLSALAAYQELYQGLTAFQLRVNPTLKEETARRRATEDARYVLPLAQTTQIGVTANAREWALIMCRLLSSDRPEATTLGKALFEALHPLAPSLFPEKYIRALTYPSEALASLEDAARRLPISTTGHTQPVQLLDAHPLDQRDLIPALLFSVGRASVAELQAVPSALDSASLDGVILSAFRGLEAHDTVLRAFETVVYRFQLELSETAYHQLVRHRMTTQIRQGHTLALGSVVPPSIEEAGLKDTYLKGIEELEKGLRQLESDRSSELLIANGHRIRVLIQLNARELVEMSRVRLEPSAQWEIRSIVQEMVNQVAQLHPAIALACGSRSEFKAGTLALFRALYQSTKS